MLKINTYIKKKGIIKTNDNIEDYFVLVTSPEAFKLVNDPCYMEGALEIIWNDRLIVGIKQWDLIDQLWIYMINGICEVLSGNKEADFWFPDQPIAVKISDLLNGNAMLIIDNKKIIEERKYLFKSLLNAANSFFINMLDIESTFHNKSGGKILDDINKCIYKIE